MGNRRALWDAADVLNGHLNSPGRAGGEGGGPVVRGAGRPASLAEEDGGCVHGLCKRSRV